MKLKYIERAVAIIVLLVKLYSLFLAADNVWRGMGWVSNYHGSSSVFYNTHFFPRLLNYLAYYVSVVWLVTGLPYRLALQKRWRDVILTALAGFAVALACLILANLLRAPFGDENGNRINLLHLAVLDVGRLSMLYAWLIAYVAFKHFIIWLWNKYKKRPRYSQKSFHKKHLLFDAILLTAIWGLSVFLASFLSLGHWVVLFALLVIPCFFVTCLLNLYWLIPAYYNRPDKGRFWFMLFGVTLIIHLPTTGLFCAMGTYSPFMLVSMFIILWVGQLALAMPAAYLIYRRRADISKEMEGLKTDLNTTEASLDMLRAQINPHFLFNALNSLYGMAIIENAEKTGEGIQRLGDMMRFMLHENNQECIPLSAEIDYLQNYISMQNMRIAASPDIKITVNIDTTNTQYHIAPMLLVPFIENAYKHGISFKEPSRIHISLSVFNGQLQFDVRNSIHPERENNLEQRISGIGLENVKQRLALLYPEQHSLVVRQTTAEYSIYLNLQLK